MVKKNTKNSRNSRNSRNSKNSKIIATNNATIRRNNANNNRTKKNNSTANNKINAKPTLKQTGSLVKFQKEIAIRFLEMLLMVKLYHWKTRQYSSHIATDEFYERLNDHMDKFMEILLGKTQVRMDLLNVKSISLIDMKDIDQFKGKLNDFKKYLVNLEENPGIKSMSNTDLLNIRDEILGHINQLLYLLSLK
jgi:DNA-binding ferritin-like protein